MQEDLPTRVRNGISKQRLKRLLDNISWLENIGAIVGVAYSGNSFILKNENGEVCYLACAFCEFSTSDELAKTINSANEINRTPVLPDSSISNERQVKAGNWLRDLRSTLKTWAVIFELEIPDAQTLRNSDHFEVSPRDSICWILDFFNGIDELPFLPVKDYDQMDVMVNQQIALGGRLRAIPGQIAPWENSSIKDPDAIIERYWGGKPIDLRNLILIRDLAFYFETILLSVIDWLDRDTNPPANKAKASDASFKITSNREKILAVIQNRGPITARGIAEELDYKLKASTLTRPEYLPYLRESGIVNHLPRLDGNGRRGFYDPKRYTPKEIN